LIRTGAFAACMMSASRLVFSLIAAIANGTPPTAKPA
jgi:hypothetical protein